MRPPWRPARRTARGARFRVHDHALFHREVGGGHAPLLRRGGDQHRARLGTRFAQLHPGVGHRGASARALHGAEGEVRIALGVGRGALHANQLPIGIEFLGDDGRKARVGTLPHLDMLGDDGDRIVGADAQERIRHEHRPRGSRTGGRTDGASSGDGPLESDGESRHRGRSRALEEGAALRTQIRRSSSHAHPFKCCAASWIAARIREYVAQRHRLPLMAPSMSASVGAPFFVSSAVADMICPDWQ